MRKAITSALLLVLGSTLALLAGVARATESGVDTIGEGAEAFYLGALPPPGLYGLVYGNHYHAGQFKDGNGQSFIPFFKLDADVVVPRVLYMSDAKLLGGRVGAYAMTSLLDVSFEAAGTTTKRSGLGDSIVGPVVSWNDGPLFYGTAVDISLPTGSFDKNQALNLGKNYYSVRPIVFFTYASKSGWEASGKFSYTFNTRNRDTDYRSGQLFHSDFSLSYPVTPAARVGVNGYYVKQTTGDRQGGQLVAGDGFKGQVFAIGPAFHYQFQKASVEARFLKEFDVRNRPSGESFWVKAVFPF